MEIDEGKDEKGTGRQKRKRTEKDKTGRDGKRQKRKRDEKRRKGAESDKNGKDTEKPEKGEKEISRFFARRFIFSANLLPRGRECAKINKECMSRRASRRQDERAETRRSSERGNG